MKPGKILIFLLFVFFLLSVLIFAFPKEGIKINNNISLYFTDFKDIFSLKKVHYADISKISDPLDSTNTTINIDSLALDTNQTYSDSLLKNIRKIEYPNNDISILYPFFYALNQLKQSESLIRIFHYGDSQIEGDRITGFIRYKLQTRFGGNGCGMMQLINATPSMSVNESVVGDWLKYTLIGKSDLRAKHNRYGAMLGFARFSPAIKDSSGIDTLIYKGDIYISPSNQGYANTRNFENIKLLYGYNKKDVKLSISANKEVVESKTLNANRDFSITEFNFDKTPKTISLQLKGLDSPDIYGFALDAKKGIAVDNIPLRGSSGYGFAQANFELLKKFYELLNVKLIIMQFGVNAVPENEKTIIPDYNYYERGFYNQLKTIKATNKDICVLVIGISDRSRKAGDYYETNPNIDKIRKAQKNAAFRAGCAYWDLFEAMGGENSMPSWVFAKPALANKDFTHFNEKGSRMVAEMFYNALIYDFYQYQKFAESGFGKLAIK